jgi:hypothetical protein
MNSKKEDLVLYFKILFQLSHGVTEDNHEKSQSQL